MLVGRENAQTILARRKRPSLPKSIFRAPIFYLIGGDESEESRARRVYAQAADDLECDGAKQSSLGRESRWPNLTRGWNNHSGFLVAPMYEFTKRGLTKITVAGVEQGAARGTPG